MNQAAARNGFLEAQKGFLIVLVVLGHAVSGFDRVAPGNEWYFDLKNAIYAFHMPAFMFLSGHVAALTFDRASRIPLGAYIAARADRLLTPFFAIGLLILAGKSIARNFAPIPNYRGEFLFDGLLNLFIFTGKSPAVSIWFVFYLFCLLVLYAFASKSYRIASIYLLILSTIIYISDAFGALSVPKIMYLNKTLDVAPFFFAGVLFGQRLESGLNDRKWLGLPCFVAFVACLLVLGGAKQTQIVVVAAAVLAIYANRFVLDRRPLRFLGGYSMVIYLFNVMVIGVMTALTKVLAPSLWTDNGLFYGFIAAVTLGGLVGPILARVIVFDRITLLRRYTR